MPSAVAGIVDDKGGFRVVVTQRWRMHHHVNRKRGERLFVVPNLEVEEPVPWDQIPWVIAQAQNYTNKCLHPINHCGECKACCITPFLVTDKFTKPAHQPCQHLCNTGCHIYWDRPEPCRQFECMWLKSQQRNDVMPPELRPDRCGVIFVNEDTEGGDPLVFEVHPDAYRPDCVEAPAVRGYIDDMQRAGYKAKLITCYTGERK